MPTCRCASKALHSERVLASQACATAHTHTKISMYIYFFREISEAESHETLTLDTTSHAAHQWPHHLLVTKFDGKWCGHTALSIDARHSLTSQTTWGLVFCLSHEVKNLAGFLKVGRAGLGRRCFDTTTSGSAACRQTLA